MWQRISLCDSGYPRKLLAFVSRCRRCVLKILWPKKITNTELWLVRRQSGTDLEIGSRKLEWLRHTLRKGLGRQDKRKRGRPKTNWRRAAGEEYGQPWDVMGWDAQSRTAGAPFTTTNVPKKQGCNNNNYYYYIPTKYLAYLSSTSFVPHAPPILVSLIWSLL